MYHCSSHRLAGLLAAGFLAAAFLQPHPAEAAVQRLDTASIYKLWTQGFAYLDVRTPKEVAAGRVPNSVNVPWVARGPGGQQQLNPNFLKQVKAAFPSPSTNLIVACQTGRRSEAAAQLLAPHFPNMVESKEGYAGWVAARLPTAS